ncbi:glycosyltransferase family 4 protein [Pectobacterium peruviense]|uniref:glycosyltransferase family 4 protein n=1 Tax=Pectobacterium peruviense TaxID=2066479 RepID=UPI001670B79E|nr:glycosyltransferase family 4 protein [Pectobacterium peruviense]
MNQKETIVLTANTSWYLYNFRRSTIKRLMDLGYRVICVSPVDDYSNRFSLLGAEFRELKIDAKSISFKTEFLTFIALYFLLKEIKPFFVYNFTIKLNVYSGLACRIINLPYANNISGLGTAFMHDGIRYKLARYLYGISNKTAVEIFFQNDDDMQLAISKGFASKHSSTLLPGSGVNVDDFSYQRKTISSGKDLCFLMVARVIADKGVREFIGAACYIKLKYPNCRFILVGDCKSNNKTSFSKETINEWCNQGVVEIVGHQDDIKNWIYTSDIVVLPSYREGMPRTILEAASCGRPAIVSDVPGCRQAVVNNETGWLCEPHSVQSLATCIEHCLHLSEEDIIKFGHNARRHAENFFSEEIVINKTIKVLSKL